VGLETGVTDTARCLAPELVHVRHRLTEGGLTSLDAMIAIAGEDMEEGDLPGEILTDLTHDHARGHLFAEGIGYLRGDDRRVMSVEEQDMEEEVDALDLGVTRYGRVAQGRGLFRVLDRDRGRTLRIRDIVEAGQGQPAGGEGVSVISEIAGRGRLRDCALFSWLTKSDSYPVQGKHLS